MKRGCLKNGAGRKALFRRTVRKGFTYFELPVMLVVFILIGLGLCLLLGWLFGPLPWYILALITIAPLGLVILGSVVAGLWENRETAPGVKPRRFSFDDNDGEFDRSVEPIPDPRCPGKFLCPQCGALLFNAVPGVTTREEIIEFVSSTRIFGDNPDAADGWIHPGLYCPNGCTWIRADYQVHLLSQS